MRRWSYSLRRVVSPALALALAAAVTFPVSAQPAGSRRDLIDDGEEPGLFLVYTGDVIGYIEPCG